MERVENEALEGIRKMLYLNLAISVLITAIVLLATSLTINHFQRRLEKMATTDKLTGLVNRQAFDLLIQQSLREQSREHTSLVAIMIDIDHFKKTNDDLGHLAGDSVLKRVAGIIENTVRKSDIVCRWGGEEFLVVLKDTAEAKGRLLAEKIRSAVESRAFRYKGKTISVTVSLGIAEHSEGEASDQLIHRADQALYVAKIGGRNRVHSAA